MTKTKRLKVLHEVYARVPSANCKGLCHAACSTIPAEPLEVAQLEAAAGRSITTTPIGHGTGVMLGTEVGAPCPFLALNRCTVYAARPLICRLYGVADGLRCRHGCAPDRVLNIEEVTEMVRAVSAVGDV